MIWKRLGRMFYLMWDCVRLAWSAFTSIFLYASHFKRQEDKKKEQDVHHYFREESRKKMLRWAMQERRKIKNMKKFIPEKDRENMCIYNYLSSVLLTTHPKQTLEQVIHVFYSYMHPYLWMYYHAWRELRIILNAKNPEKAFKQRLPLMRYKYRNLEDLKKRSLQILEVKKQVSLAIRAKEKDYKKKLRDKEESADERMLQIQEEILQKRREEADKDLEALKKAKEQQKKLKRV